MCICGCRSAKSYRKLAELSVNLRCPALVILLLSVKYHTIETDPNKNINTGSQLSDYFTFLFVKSKIYLAKKHLFSLKYHLLVYHDFSKSSSVAIITR